jgi:hypothetical protein
VSGTSDDKLRQEQAFSEKILGLPAHPDERALLGLPPGEPLRSGQIEAALGERLQQIKGHALAGTAGAARLAQHLEDAADKLQVALMLEGRGPLHPAAARRAGRVAELSSRRAAENARVVQPEAVRRSTGLSAADLTEFDRLVLAVLVVSGGWNARSAKRLAVVAEDLGVTMPQLNTVVLGLTRFLAEGEGLRGAMGQVGSSARSTYLDPRTFAANDRASRLEGAVERALSRINDVVREEVAAVTPGSQYRLTAIFTLFALSWVGVLAWVFFGRGDRASDVPAAGGETVVAKVPAPPPVDGGRDANGAPIEPLPPLAAPVKYPRPPGFTLIPAPRELLDAGGAGAIWVAGVEEFGRTVGADTVPDAAALTSLQSALLAAGDAWPFAGNYRVEASRALEAAVRALRSAEALRLVMESIPGGVEPAAGSVPPWKTAWREAFGAGVLATIALDATQSPGVAAAAREEMRRRDVAIPRGTVVDPFGVAAVSSLARSARGLAEGLALGTQDLEAASRWRQAVDVAATSPALRNKAALAAIDAALRAPGALDKPGPLVDFLAVAIHALDFSGRGESPDAVRDALADWILNANVPPARLWAFTSLLDQDLGIAWYGPDLVLSTNADTAERKRIADRLVQAYPRPEQTTVGEATAIAAGDYEAWTELVTSAGNLPRSDAADAMRRAAVMLALARTARAYETLDPKEARASATATESLITREEREWNASPSGQRAGLPAAGVVDGEFAEALQASGRDTNQRMNVIRALGTRPAAGDLGPLDARAIVFEALRGLSPEVRAAAATVVIDRYSDGPVVLRTVIDLLPEGGTPNDARDFISHLAGAGVAGADWKVEARTRLVARLFLLEDSRSHALDAASAELSAIAGELSTMFDPTSSAAFAQPDRALAALVDAMRTAARGQFLAEPFPASIDEIERQRSARRSLANGTTQRMAAETPAILQYAAMIRAARQPNLEPKLVELLTRAGRARGVAVTALDQVAGDLEALVSVMGEGLAPEANARDAQ